MPGMGEEMEGAMQQAPQPARQFNMMIFTLDTAGNPCLHCMPKA